MEFKKLIEKNKQLYLNELVKYCSQPSVSSENDGMAEMFEIVRSRLVSLGAHVDVVTVGTSYPFALADLRATTDADKKPTVLIYNHYDVQPASPVELWDSPAFSPEIRDDKFYARGVADNKGNLLQRIQAIELIKNNMDLPVNIKWLIEGEEEIGSPHVHDLQTTYGDFWKDSDVCVWEVGSVTVDGAPILSLGMKGILYIELECEFNDHDLHSGNAACIDSPVWRLIHALATIRNVDGEVTIDGYYKNLRTPTDLELELMRDSNYDPMKVIESLGAQKTLVDPKDKLAFQKTLYFKSTANICGITAGYTTPGGIKTILPNKAMAKVDFRLVPDIKIDEVLDLLRKHLDARGFDDIKITKLGGEECGKSELSNVHIQKCIDVMTKSYGKSPQINIINPASGPIYHIASEYNIPVVQIGCSYPGSNAHAPNENIRISDYFNSIDCFINYLFALKK